MGRASARRGSELRLRFRERTAGVCWVTVTTPFARDGSLDERALRANLQVYGSHASSRFPLGFVAGGTYGECLAMTDPERLAVIKATVEEAQGRIPVVAVAFSGDARLDRSLELLRSCAALGVDAVCVAPPTYYFKPTIDGVEAWLSTLTREVATGIVLYNLAGRFGYYLEAHEVARLAEALPTLVGMKLAAPSLEKQVEMIKAVGQSIGVVEGAEAHSPRTIPAGAAGYMSSTAAFAPAVMAQWSRAIVEGDSEALEGLQRRFARYRAFQAAVRAEPPSVLKAAMDAVGLAGGSVRLPLTPLSKEQRAELELALRDLRLPAARRARASSQRSRRDMQLNQERRSNP